MENQTSKKLLFIVYTSLAIALVTLSTMVIRIPVLRGFINFGDIMIFVTAILLGRKAGFIAGAFGSALADMLSGYMVYAPATFLIKGLEGLICASLIWKNTDYRDNTYSLFISPIIAGMWMVFGYFIYDFILFGIIGIVIPSIPGEVLQSGFMNTVIFVFKNSLIGAGAAIPAVPANILQGGVSAAAAIPIVLAMKKVKFSLNTR